MIKLISHKTILLTTSFLVASISLLASASDNESSAAEGKLNSVPEANYHKLHILQGHWDDINDVTFSPNGKYAATASNDDSLIVWNVNDGSQKFDAKFENNANVMAASFSPDNKYIFTGFYDSNLKGKGVQFSIKKEKVEYAVPLLGVVEMEYSPDGESLVVGYINDTTPVSIINIKKAKKGKKKGRLVLLRGHTGMVRSVEFSPDGDSVLTTALDGNMVVWNAESGRRQFGIKADLNDATFSPDGQYIATSATGALNLLSAKDGRTVRSIVEASDENLYAYELLFDVDFHPNGQTIAAASSNGSVYFFDVNSGKTISKITDAHTDQIVSLEYNHDGTKLITGSMDDTAIIWDLK